MSILKLTILQKIDAILTTHKHWDHAGGNTSLIEKFPDIKVYGGREDGVDGCTNQLDDYDTITFGDYTIEVYTTPCHTVGHVIYVITNIGSKRETIAFTGDFLFMASCGMFFEGTAAQMQRCFDKFLEICPSNTKLFYGHEYAVGNLKFALYVDPENEAAQQKYEEVLQKQEEKEICLPGLLSEELEYNPFLRADTSSILKVTKTEDKIDALAILRRWKDDKVHLKDEEKKAK